MDSRINPGRLKKNFDRSNTPRVVRNLRALDAFSRTGRKTWLAFTAATGWTVEIANAEEKVESYTSVPP
jgi:hypothetical protein